MGELLNFVLYYYKHQNALKAALDFAKGAGFNLEESDITVEGGPEGLIVVPLKLPQGLNEYAATRRLRQFIDQDGVSVLFVTATTVTETDKPPTLPLFWVKVLANVLNVRSGPAPTFEDIGDVILNQRLAVYAVAPGTGWYKIEPDKDFWISGSPAYTEKLP